MAGMKFEYDESGAKFVYFILSFYAMIIIPATYYFWPRKETKKFQHAEDLTCFEPCIYKNRLLNKDQPRRQLTRRLIQLVLVFGWVIFFFLAYKASQIEIEHKEYDPYAILGLDRSATDKEIKKQYRELSKTMHPDKGGDEEKFKQLAKAYQALTDEETKKNWQEYGNPDGPGVTQFGIALPKWIVDGKNSYLVLGVYVLIFMIFLPIIVGSWWYKSIKYTGDQVLLTTSQLYGYLLMKSPQLNLKKAIMILSSSKEFERYSNPEIKERPTDNVEVPQLIKELTDMQEKVRERPFSDPYSLKARALIYAHLNRVDLPRETLMNDKNVIIGKCPFLINEMINTATNLIAAVSANYVPKANCPKLESIENLMKLSPMIVQALTNKSKNNTLQLPHLDESHLRYFFTKKRRIMNVRDFVSVSETDRRSILRNLKDDQYDEIMRVCASYPVIQMDAHVKIIDDEDEHTITAGALTTLVIKLERTSMGDLINREETISKISQVEQLNSLEAGDDEDRDSLLAAESNDGTKTKSAAHKPWEKQKKKPKYLGSKPKPKPAAAKAAAKAKPGKPTKEDEKLAKTEKAETENDEAGDEAKKEEDVETGGEESEISEASESEEVVETVSKSDKAKKSAESGKEDQDGDEYFEKFQLMQKKKEKLETKKKVSHRVYCPFFPQIKQECWWLYVADRKQNSLICSPAYICTLKDTEEVELKFLAPKTPGHFNYSVILRSDSYVDFDVVTNIKFEVQPAKKVESHPQWEFTDEEAANNGDEPDQDDEFTTESESE